MRRWSLAALALGALVALPEQARADGAVQVTPDEVDEGRPVTLHVAWIHSGSDPAGLLAFEAQVVGASERVAHPGPSLREALWLDPLSGDAVTLDLEAHETLGAQARAPRPPVTGQLAGTPVTILRQVVPGESLALSLAVVPGAVAVEVAVRVRRLPLRADGPLAGAQVLVPGPTWAWRPGPLGHVGSEPDPGLPTISGVDPDPLGAGLGDPRAPGGVDLRVRVTRWVPRGLGPSPEVLLHRDALDALAPEDERHLVQVKVRPAPFGRAAALAKSTLAAPTHAVRLADDRWVVEDPQAGRAAVVAATGAPVVVDGRPFPAALDLARDGRLALTWYEAHEHPDLARALEQGGLVKGRGKGLQLEVTPDTLVPFLEALRAHGARFDEGRIVTR